MKITRIVGQADYSSKIAMACIKSGLERQARHVLSVSGDTTTSGILRACHNPAPYAILIHDYDPAGPINLEALRTFPRLSSTLCFIEEAAAVKDEQIGDILPARVGGHTD